MANKYPHLAGIFMNWLLIIKYTVKGVTVATNAMKVIKFITAQETKAAYKAAVIKVKSFFKKK